MADSPRRFRVLIVDDEPPVVQFAARALDLAGYQTITASDAESALATVAAAGVIDLLLTDLMMPGMRGDELARALRAQDPDLPVLYLTGYSDQLFKDRAQLWANETFVDKPVTVQALQEAVSLALFGHMKGPRTD